MGLLMLVEIWLKKVRESEKSGSRVILKYHNFDALFALKIKC